MKTVFPSSSKFYDTESEVYCVNAQNPRENAAIDTNLRYFSASRLAGGASFVFSLCLSLPPVRSYPHLRHHQLRT